jgi:NADP-dependent 3-hydroxy acid dehydrogenase YdfG
MPTRTRTILITGASSGIGRALALEYARGAASVALCARRTAKLEEVAGEVRALGGTALVLPLDVTDPEAVADTLRRADRELGALDMVIANAGMGTRRHASRLTWQDVAPIVDVNLGGAMATLVAAVPIFLAHQRGHLVGVSSLAGRRALPMSAAYCASKSALSAFLESLRIDLVPAGLRVTDVRPGFVDTPLLVGRKQGTPYLWSVDRAARHIVKKLDRAPAVLAFPWQLVLATGLGRLLPASIYDWMIRAGLTRS